MAGNVPKRLLKQPEVDKCLLAGTRLWKFEENEPPQKLTFYSDKDAFFLWAVGDNPAKYYDQHIWDLQTISDVRSGKPPKDSKLPQPSESEADKGGIFLTLVVRKDGIVNLEMHNLTAETPAVATMFKKAVNSLTRNMLMPHAAPAVFLKKQYVRIKLHANGNGEIPLKSINKVMMVRFSPDNFLNQWLGSFNIVKDSADGKLKVVHVDDFTEDLFSKMLDQLLNNRDKDMDVVFSNLTTGKHRGKMSLPLNDFLTFLNERQRDPRLNEILFPIKKKSEAAALIQRHEKAKNKDRMTSRGLMEYLASEENNLLDMDHLSQNHDMSQPISNYYINSSHNTYLTGHQLRSSSTTEMYAQCLLMGCRCLELDCWVENDDIIITHGGTFCGKVGFKEVVETINEFAFVASDYPVILSIENHCRKYPHLLQRMATIFKMVFGDKLLGSPLEDYPMIEGSPLPPPEFLKGKILIKDKKVRRGAANTSMTNLGGTLQRGAHLPSVPEEMESMTGEEKKTLKKKSEEDQDSVTSDIPAGAIQKKEGEGEKNGEGEGEKQGSSDEDKGEKEKEGSYDVTDGPSNEQSEVAEADPEGGVEGAVVIKIDFKDDDEEGEVVVGGGGEGETKQQMDTQNSETASSPDDGSKSTSDPPGGAGGGGTEGRKTPDTPGGAGGGGAEGRKTPDTPGSGSAGSDTPNSNVNALTPGGGGNSEGEGGTGGGNIGSGEQTDTMKKRKKALAILGIDEDGNSTEGGPLTGSAAEGDITQINVALLHRTSDADISVTGPLADLINYCTSISFEGFAVAEKTNCSHYMSSFVEEKGLNLIKTQGKDFVKYNQRQFSRIYPQGSRISSSNYGPLIYWSVGCQLVALNFQTSDIPMQINTAKFEFNGGTGYLLKPWVMTRDRAGTGGGDFNPFVQSKLEDIVPAKLTIKIVSGFFLTEKRTNCYVECEMFGLPADNLRHKYYTKRVAAPHPFWNDDEFKFKRILLPELAMLRVCVYDDDKEIVGQRTLPVNAIRPGFRHINLRDKHGTPLPLAMLFVLITVEDWVPDEMEDIVAMLMDPISYATQVLKEMDEDLGDDEKAFMAKQEGGGKDQTDSASSKETSKSSLAPKNEEITRSVSPKHEPMERRSSGQTNLGIGSPTPYASQSLKRGEAAGLVAKGGALPGAFDDTLPCLESAKTREAPKAISHDDSIVLDHGEYKKLQSKLEKKRTSLVKSQEKTMKTLQEKLAKGKPGMTDDHVKELQKKHTVELVEFDKKASTEKYEKKRTITESAHKVQMKTLTEKVHKTDVKTVNLELGETMRKHRKGSDFGAGLDRNKSLMAEIEDKTVTLGRKTRTEFQKIHQSEVTKLMERQKHAIKDLVQWQAMELDKINSRLESATND